MRFSSTSAEALTQCVGPKIGLGASGVDMLYKIRLPWDASAFEVRIPGSHVRKAHVSHHLHQKLWRKLATWSAWQTAERGRNRVASEVDKMTRTAVLSSKLCSIQRTSLVAARIPPGT